MEGALVSEDRPLSAHGPWLQVWVGPQSIDTLVEDIESCLAKENVSIQFLTNDHSFWVIIALM